MKILHTSDWHLGRALYGRKRYEEFSAFLDWLAQRIEDEAVDALIVAGDVFDTSTPGNRAQELYYTFLCRVSRCCGHLVVVGGNHDSPSFLNAPRALLKSLNVHVVGSMDVEQELVVLRDAEDVPVAIICAVPYLRDRDLRLAEAGESLEDKRSKLAEGFRAHYEEMANRAERVRGGLAIPVVATGHCFAAGGVIQEGDGVRDLSVGSLDYIEASLFSGCFDYVALGHLHVPQKVAGSDVIRYSGSPIPMGFGEASQQKRVLEVEFEGRSPTVNEIAVPCFQPLRRIAGTVDELLLAVEGLKEDGSIAWLEIEYSGEAIVPDLRDQLEAAIEGSELEICRIKNRRVMNRVLQQIDCAETLDDLEPSEVFTRCLTAHEIPAEQQVELRAAYQEILRTVLEADPCAG